jgi:acyl transferase domain-containing protein
VGAIRRVFCEGRDNKKPLFVGTAKPNLGHSEAASGSAGLIKTIMAMEKGLIPPNILLENLKPGLELDQWNIKVRETSSSKVVIDCHTGRSESRVMAFHSWHAESCC